ncbi:MAG: DUF1549 domain-containing protein, partial [Armatimonadetes bacterium]|nr:DUF1549 domain-containing protein [Armatimonadota bacterium]
LPGAAAAAPGPRTAPAGAGKLEVYPASVRLTGPDALQQLLVTETGTDGLSQDRTDGARYTALPPAVVRVSPAGLVTPIRDGKARLRVQVGRQVRELAVVVEGAGAERRYHFLNDITPILSRAGCNQGACHGKAEGQGGFKLSVFGYDPDLDYAQILTASKGRRVSRTDPARSLFLLKPGGGVPHAGGVRFSLTSREYRTVLGWLAAGAPFGKPDEPVLQRVSVEPLVRSAAFESEHRLLVTAHYSDGATRDVTRLARFATNSPQLAGVGDDGRIRTQNLPGDAAIMAHYGGMVAVSRVVTPRPDRSPLPAPPTPRNFLDTLVWNRLRTLRIAPSGAASDAEFLRRAYLDTIGSLPTPEEARAFLDECRKEGTPAWKARTRLVDQLLERPEYADFWAIRWADLLRVNKDRLGAKGAHAFYSWIRTALAENRPYDQFVRELITASGSSNENGAVQFYRVLNKPEELAGSVSQVFLGVRIECAQCHHHPFEKWSQDDYYGMVGYFTRVNAKGLGPGAALVSAGGNGNAVNPRTKAVVAPHPLGGPVEPEAGDADRRRQLATWMTRPDNPFLARMLVNRLWSHFLGRGL